MAVKVLCTHVGKFGDALWAMPTARALSEQYGVKVDLWLPGSLASIVPLLQRQAYLGTVTADPNWVVQDTAPATPRIPPELPEGYDLVVHLSYDGWPQDPLPYEAARMAARYVGDAVVVNLARPWIDARRPLQAPGSDEPLVIGFTDEWFELKVGLSRLVIDRWQRSTAGRWTDFVCGSPRWDTEAGRGHATWEQAASQLARAQVALCDCSALHVLAVAVGTPVVVMEPNEHRWHRVFWPLGRSGPQVYGVDGNDRQPSFDARHCADQVITVAGRAR